MNQKKLVQSSNIELSDSSLTTRLAIESKDTTNIENTEFKLKLNKMTKNITTQIKCTNIAPFKNLNAQLLTSSLKVGIYATNGSGKTYLSRMFRLLEHSDTEIEPLKINRLINHDSDTAHFEFKITDKEGNTKEHIDIQLERDKKPNIQKSDHYIYHTFNQDYVAENIQNNHYEHNSDTSNYVLGRKNIQIESEDSTITKHNRKIEDSKKIINQKIAQHKQQNTDNIPNIKKFPKYKILNADELLRHTPTTTSPTKTLKEELEKITSLPENLEDIKLPTVLSINTQTIDETLKMLQKEYTTSTIGDDFKKKINDKEDFIKSGHAIQEDSESCPYCEQKLTHKEIELIDKYSQYINDTEATTKSTLREKNKELAKIIQAIASHSTQCERVQTKHNQYRTKHFPEINELTYDSTHADITEVILKDIQKAINEKLQNIRIKQDIESNQNNEINTNIISILEQHAKLTKQVNAINKAKNDRSDIRKKKINEIIIASKNELAKLCETEKKTIKDCNTAIEIADEKIQEIKKSESKEVKEKVYKTTCSLLKSFYNDKYVLDEETFKLKSNNKNIEPEYFLSEGEKSTVAFCYYIAQVHKTSKGEYDKLFFVIDDPISSMDYNHIYNVTNTIQNLSKTIPAIDTLRYLLLTHNTEFMRTITGNNITDNNYILNNSKLQKTKNNFTVSYIDFLKDVYDVSKGRSSQTHGIANAMRQILEAIYKFENIDTKFVLRDYLKTNSKFYKTTSTHLHDMSHGSTTTPDPITPSQYKEICGEVIGHVKDRYPGQVRYVSNLT